LAFGRLAKYGHGFITSKPVVMFYSKTLAVIKTLDVQGNPDGYLDDPYNNRVYILSHVAPNVTVIDAKDGAILGTIDLGGAPEQAVLRRHAPSPVIAHRNAKVSRKAAFTDARIEVVRARSLWNARSLFIPEQKGSELTNQPSIHAPFSKACLCYQMPQSPERTITGVVEKLVAASGIRAVSHWGY
jgi:hypothetical protein